METSSPVAKQRPSANSDSRMKIVMLRQHWMKIGILIEDTYLIHPISGFDPALA